MQRLGRTFINQLSSSSSSSLNQYVSGRSLSSLFTFDAGQPTPATHPQLIKEGEITPGISEIEYISRRKKLLELLPDKGIAVIASAPMKMMTDVVPYPFRQDADYLYITGCIQPGGVAVLGKDIGLCMFMPSPDPREVTWQGQVAGVEAALEIFKADKAFPIEKMQKILPDIIGKGSRLFMNGGTKSGATVKAIQEVMRGGKVEELANYIDELRYIKSPAELKLMRESASIASQAMLQTVLLSKSHPDEGTLAAKVEFECRKRGAQRMAFYPVVGGGANGSVIHYSRNDQIESLYNLILETGKSCMKLCKPGSSIQEIHNYSVQMLQNGLQELGIMKGKANLSFSYHQLNPTSIGHYLGMDIHDCSTISNSRQLQPGVVITIEPGVYIPMSSNAPEKFRGIGIRIEDEILITETGNEVLTGSLPKEIDHITSLLKYSERLGYGSY